MVSTRDNARESGFYVHAALSVYFLVHGTPLAQTRPKGDRTSLAVMRGRAPGGGHEHEEGNA